VIGQLGDVTGLRGGEEEEAVALGADASGAAHAVHVLRGRDGRVVLDGGEETKRLGTPLNVNERSGVRLRSQTSRSLV